MHKGQAFRDSLCLRYGWDPPLLPATCVCGVTFTIDHALNCSCGGLPSQRHNYLRDITASLLKEASHNVTTEPNLQPLSGENLHPRSAITEDNARSDIRTDGFWSCDQQSSFFDVKIFNPTALTYCTKSLPSCYRRLEDSKRRQNHPRRTWHILSVSFLHVRWDGTICLYRI